MPDRHVVAERFVLFAASSHSTLPPPQDAQRRVLNDPSNRIG